MPVPSWESTEIALLKEMEDSGGSIEVQKAIWGLLKYFPQLSQDELSVRLESGDIRWANRVRWARQSLVQKGDLDPSTFGIWRITEKGRKRLAEAWLDWKPKYVEEVSKPITPTSTTSVDKEKIFSVTIGEGEPPYETLQNVRDYYADQVADGFLERVGKVQPSVFEAMVAELLKRMSYGEPRVTGRSGDGQIDGVCSMDELGVDKILFQAKRWKANVPPEKVGSFIGAVSRMQARGGILVTTSDFTEEGRQHERESKKIVLVNGKELARLMIKYGIGVKKKSLEVPELDEDYFQGL